MWCSKCHYGSEVWKGLPKCPNCSGMEFMTKNPFTGKPRRSIRAMNKRIGYHQPSTKTDQATSMKEDVEAVIKNAQHNK